MKPVKSKKTIEHTVVLKPARYKKKETGKTMRVEVELQDGGVETRLEPIYETYYIPPETKTEEKEVDIWLVKDGNETHEFLNAKDAKDFCK